MDALWQCPCKLTSLWPEEEIEWSRACDEELASLLEHGTWRMKKPPPGVSVVGSRWVFKKKLNALGQVELYKAQLVAQGTRSAGYTHRTLEAPVGKHATLCALLALEAAEDLEIHEMDVKTAYLHGELEESVWMNPPPAYVVGPPGTVCRLQKAVYGMKQASRAGHAVLRSILGGADLACLHPGLFVQRVSRKDGQVYVLAWVDDLLIVGDHTATQRVHGQWYPLPFRLPMWEE
jgi:hypothetical protein